MRITISEFEYETRVLYALSPKCVYCVLNIYVVPTTSLLDNASIPAFGTSRTVASNLKLSNCLSLATEWMKQCKEEHTMCSRPKDARLPTRVVDVGLDEKSDTICLKETEDSDQDLYMSLSHCWGKNRSLPQLPIR